MSYSVCEEWIGEQLRRLVAQGGVRKNGVPVTSMEDSIENEDVLRIGKKKFVKLILNDVGVKTINKFAPIPIAP